MIDCDLLIVGCGPAGMMAAIYAKRANKKIIILDKGNPGGRVLSTYKVDNYLGFSRVSAEELVSKMINHLHDLEIEDTYGDVLDITYQESIYTVKTDISTYQSKAVIIASGTEPRPMGVKNEKFYLSRGLSYCAVCDGIFFEGKDVCVVGGGDSALEESLYLAEIAKSVTIIHDLPNLTAAGGLVNRVKKNPKVSILSSTQVIGLLGDPILSAVIIKDLITGEEKSFLTEGLFVYVGNLPRTEFLKNLNVLDKAGFISVNTEMSTKMPGLFACGDVTKKDYRLIATAISDGAIAALSAVKFLDK
ncbi:MAG: thioredoxin-disulfide reductase [Tenericutes bacterium HGW-Tenericutes-1]|jgi:thioredoxin reductase (NADPH)|nr:MAG: thioredoxin-disulfide reductase [Tenericutes bacterium HGW-Tenericutes-1]